MKLAFEPEHTILEGKNIHYRIKALIGRGRWSTVYSAEVIKDDNTPTYIINNNNCIHDDSPMFPKAPKIGELVAIKVAKKQVKRYPESMMLYRLFSRLNNEGATFHPNLVEIYETGTILKNANSSTKTGNEVIVQKLYGPNICIPLKTKHRKRKNSHTKFQIKQALYLSLDMFSSISVMHSLGIVHSDIKPDNVVVIPDADYRPGGYKSYVICDYGNSIDFEQDNEYNISDTPYPIMSPGFNPPEVMYSKQIAKNADCWSIGATLYEFLYNDYYIKEAAVETNYITSAIRHEYSVEYYQKKRLNELFEVICSELRDAVEPHKKDNFDKLEIRNLARKAESGSIYDVMFLALLPTDYDRPSAEELRNLSSKLIENHK